MTHPGPHCQGCALYIPPPISTRAKILSMTWPWDHGYHTVNDVIAVLVDLGATEVSIRTPEYMRTSDMPSTNSYNPAFNKALVTAARAKGMLVSLWPIVSLFDPLKMAAAVKKEVELYKPVRVVLDIEGAWIANYGKNTMPFLQALGNVGVPVGLGSYRRPSLHSEIRWQDWLRTQVDGKYVIGFQAAQMYPIGWMRPESWVYQFRLDIDSHEAQHIAAGRPDLPWLPWLPAFAEGLDPYGKLWYPRIEGVKAAVEYMEGRLGSRLLGLNWWSLDQDLIVRGTIVDPRFTDLYVYIKSKT